jgi:O-Antigen ligase
MIRVPDPVLRAREQTRTRTLVAGALLLGLGAVLAALIALAGPPRALLALGAVFAGALVVAAALRPTVAMTVIIVAVHSNAPEVLHIQGMYSALIGLGLLSTVLALRDPVMRGRMRRPSLPVMLLFGCYLLSLVPSVLGSSSPSDTATVLGFLAKDTAFLMVVVLLGHLVQKPWRIAATVAVTLAVLAAFTIINQLVLGNLPSAFGGFATVTTASGELTTTPRHAGPLTDSNFWGRSLILGLPLAYALAHRAAVSRRWLPLLVWGLTIALLLGGAYLTQSRGTFLSALAVTVVWLVAAGPGMRRRALLLAPVALLAVAVVPGVGNRLVNLDELFSSKPTYMLDPSLVDRVAVQRISGIIFSDHPLCGVGPGAFPTMVDRYAAETGDFVIGTVIAPHNLYLELAVESGIIGLTGWLVMIIGILVLSCRAIVRLAGVSDDGSPGLPTRGLAGAGLAAVLGWSLASLFLHLEYLPSLMISIVLIGLIHARSADVRAAQTPAALAASARTARALRAGSAIGAATTAAVVALVAVVLVVLAPLRYSSVAQYTLLPTVPGWESYLLDIRSREPVLPAYAAMLERGHNESEERADADPARGVIILTAYGNTREQAESNLAAFAGEAPQALEEYAADRAFRLVLVSPPDVEVERTFPGSLLALTAAAVVGELVLIKLLATWFRRRYRQVQS